VEAEGAYVKPELRIAVSADAESAAPVTATETIQQFTIGGDLVWYLPVHRWSSRLAPFAIGGAGYMWQLHDPATLVDTGSSYHVGGGVTLRGGRWHMRRRLAPTCRCSSARTAWRSMTARRRHRGGRFFGALLGGLSSPSPWRIFRLRSAGLQACWTRRT
jgi:hypothetical protein